MNKEFLKMQKTAGIITEGQYREKLAEDDSKKYYAVINILDQPSYFMTDTKEEMLDMLNKAYKDSTGETYVPYSIEDFNDENRMYMDKQLPHFISDDWTSVTDDQQVFDTDINNLKSQGLTPEKYM